MRLESLLLASFVAATLAYAVTSLAALHGCSSSQADKAALARDGIKLAQDACVAYERSPKRDEQTDRLCLALELAARAATSPSVTAAGGAQ